MFPPTELSSAMIQHSFGRLLAEQGALCATQSQLHLQQFNALNQSDIEVKALVYENKSNRFETSLYYQAQADWPLSGDCTCPAATDCKHCAAVAYAWLAQQAPEPASQADLDVWLKALESIKSSEQSPETNFVSKAVQQEIVYLLDLFEPGTQSLSLLCVQAASRQAIPSKNGSLRWRKPTAISLGALALSASEIDHELHGLLRHLETARFEKGKHSKRDGSRIALTGKLGTLVLELLLKSQRAYWSGPEDIATDALTEASERQIQLDWETLPGGQQLRPRVEPRASQLFQLGQDVYYHDQRFHQLGKVNIKPEKLNLLLQAPLVPQASLETVSRSLLSLLPAPPLPQGIALSEQLIETEQIQVILSLQGESDEESSQQHSNQTYPAQAKHLARLVFSYDGHRVEPGLVFEPEVSLLVGNQVYRIKRQQDFESKAHQELIKTGLLPLSGLAGAYGFASESAPAELPMTYIRNWHHWLNDSLSHLRLLGWQIEIEASFRLAFLSSPAWQAELSLKPSAKGLQQKWFELSLGIDIHGQRVELLPLILRMLKTVPDPRALREELEKHSTWLMPLDPHPLKTWAAASQHQKLPQQWLEIPARRLAWILDLLIEIYDYLPDAQDPEQLKLSEFQALQIKSQVVLNPDDYGVSWQAPPALNEAAKSLAGLVQDGLQEIPVPTPLQAELRPYQQRGLNWLQSLRELGVNGILADEMGLGKTLQTLAHLLVEKEAGRLDAPALIVVPTSVLINWQREAQRFAPELRVLALHGSERDLQRQTILNSDLVLTSYTLMRKDRAFHSQIQYSWLILDEAQIIKNPRSETARLLCAQPSRHRLCLSGTPIENQLEELWSLFHFLMPGFLDTLERFNSRFRHPIERQGDTRAQKVLRERVRPFVLRRRKQQVERELPPKIEILRTVDFGNAQRDLYETMRLAVDFQVNRIIREKGLKRSRIAILDALLKLRQICCHPPLLDLPEAQTVRHSAKLELLMELLPELVSEGRRILVFSQFVTMLQVIESRLQEAELPYVMLTGRIRQRQPLIDRFQAGEVPIFLISLKAGGLGLNLTAADTVIHYDPWWNPASEEQATGRAWRIGQQETVFVYKLIAAGTLEEKILMMQASKQALSDALFDEASAQGLQAEALLSLLK